MSSSKQQQEIEHGVFKQERKRREAEDDDYGGLFTCYADPSRNIAVGDTKAELSAVIRTGVEEDSGEDSDVCHRQALHFLSRAEYSAALELVERARMTYLDNRETEHLDTSFINIVSTQAVCLLKLGDYVTSKKFAEQVLMRTQSCDAQLVKAEAEYNLCHFEHALVTYYKGIKMNPEMEGFHHGVDKCKETISNIVRKQDIFAFQGIQAFLEFYLRETQPKKKFSCIDATHKTKSKKVLMAGGKTKNPKGLRKRPNRMSVDKMFLRNLAQQLSDMDIAGPWGESVTNKAIEGIEFLGKRDDFWNQIDTL